MARKSTSASCIDLVSTSTKRLIHAVNQDVVIAIIRYKAASWRGFAHKQSSRHAHDSVNSDLKTAQFHFWRQGSPHATHYTLPSFFVSAIIHLEY